MATPRPSPRAPFGATLALTLALALAAFVVVMAVVMTLVPGTPLPAPFPEQHQHGETLSYLIAFVVLVPLAGYVARRLADAVAGGPNGAALGALAAVLLLGLTAMVVAVKTSGRVLHHDGVKAIGAAAIVWWAAALALLRAAVRVPAGPRAAALARAEPGVWALTALATVVALACFADLHSVSVPGLLVGIALALAVLAAHGRAGLPALPRRWGVAVDAVALLAVLALVPDLVIFRPEEAAGDIATALETGIIQFHQNFLLGPANEVLHGRPMLVGTASQYGVTSIYLLDGWFQLAPIGYGTLGFLTGALTALWFAAGYLILRLARTSRLLAAAALGLGVVVLVFNLPYPVGALPQSGPLRFGMPMALVLAAVAGERFPQRARAGALAAAALVGLSSVWSFESFAYTAATFAAIAGGQAWLAPPPRRRRFARRVAEAALACLVAHAVFAGVTLAATGHLPDWGQYLAYLREFLTGTVGDLTYDVERWTAGLAVGAAYAASAAALVELLRRGGPLVERERAALVAITGVTAYGIVLLSYYVDRSQAHILIHVSLPALLTGALWLGVLLRSRAEAGERAVRAGLGAALVVAVMLLAVGWSAIGPRFPRSPLAHVIPGGDSLGAALTRLWHPPPLAPAAPAGERALDRYMPGERRSLVMVSPDLGTEVLLRAGRADGLHLGDPWEASFADREELPAVRSAVDGLRVGRRMLLDPAARLVLAALRADAARNPLRDPLPGLAPLQEWALQRIDRRFGLRTVAPADSAGFSVAELTQRAGT